MHPNKARQTRPWTGEKIPSPGRAGNIPVVTTTPCLATSVPEAAHLDQLVGLEAGEAYPGARQNEEPVGGLSAQGAQA